jgi:hypothetical protein
MQRKINYFLNIKKAKKLKNFYKLIFMKLNAAKRVNEKKKNIRKKRLLIIITVKRKNTI